MRFFSVQPRMSCGLMLVLRTATNSSVSTRSGSQQPRGLRVPFACTAIICTGEPDREADGSVGLFEAVTLSTVADTGFEFEAGFAAACSDVAALPGAVTMGCTGGVCTQAEIKMRMKPSSPAPVACRLTFRISLNEL